MFSILLGLPTRRILTDGAVPSLFSFTKQTKKRKSAEQKQEDILNDNKRQLVEGEFSFTKQSKKRRRNTERRQDSNIRQPVKEALENFEEIEEKLLTMNSKSSQTENTTVSVSIQTDMTCFQNDDKTTQKKKRLFPKSVKKMRLFLTELLHF